MGYQGLVSVTARIARFERARCGPDAPDSLLLARSLPDLADVAAGHAKPLGQDIAGYPRPRRREDSRIANPGLTLRPDNLNPREGLHPFA